MSVLQLLAGLLAVTAVGLIVANLVYWVKTLFDKKPPK